MHLGKLSLGWGVLLAGHVTTAPGLEADDDLGDLHVALLLQVGQDSGPEEHLALPDPVQVGVQLQAFDLTGEKGATAL